MSNPDGNNFELDTPIQYYLSSKRHHSYLRHARICNRLLELNYLQSGLGSDVCPLRKRISKVLDRL